MSLQHFYAKLETAQTSWSELNDRLVQGGYDFSRARPILNGGSVDLLRRQITLCFEVLQSLRPEKESDVEYVAVSARVPELAAQIDVFIRQVKHMLDQFSPHWTEGASIRDQNDNFNIQLATADGTSLTGFDFNDQFRQVLASLISLLAISAQLLPITKANGVADLVGRAEKLGSAVRQAEQFRKQTEKHEGASAVAASNVTQHEAEIRSVRTQIETLLSQIHALQVQATTDTGSVAALIERIRTIAATSESLEQSVNSYQSKFDDFEAKLTKRNREFAEFELEKVDFTAANDLREKQIDKLSQLADAMISGATTVGLAKSLEDARKRYEDRLNSTRRGFYFAVFLLVVSALPLAAHLLPGLFGNLIPGLDAKVDGSPYGVLGRVLLLLPATWLTAFFTKAYAELFHTEREYAHKAALAMSIDGFKRQAPKYEEEITAEVFMEIRQNPGNGRSVEAASHPLYDVLSKAVEKVLPEKK